LRAIGKSATALSGCIPHSTFYNPHSHIGGIAQLVERQLCKLEVRGSNPLASIFRSAESVALKIAVATKADLEVAAINTASPQTSPLPQRTRECKSPNPQLVELVFEIVNLD
jgi:hypothetical protein